MTTRSGATYKPTMEGERVELAAGETARTGESSAGSAPLDWVRMLMEDRRRRDEELAEERRRRELEASRHEKELREQMDMIKRLVETSSTARARDGDSDGGRSSGRGKVVLTKYAEGDDVEAYLTTFERLMTVHRVDNSLWVVHLAPQLAGRAQQAYAALPGDKAGSYEEVKMAILRRYDISPETYRQRFRAARRKEQEAYSEFATRLQDLAKKWLSECDSVQAVLEKVVLEQFLDTLPRDLKIWLCERKPTTVESASSMADDYRSARRRKRPDAPRPDTSKKDGPGKDNRKCHLCKQEGHIAANCTEKAKQSTEPSSMKERSRDRSERRCYNCHQQGHLARDCPSALYCGVIKTSGSQGSEGRDAGVGSGGVAHLGVLEDMGGGGDTGGSGEGVEEREPVGDGDGGDLGQGDRGEEGTGATWGCVEEGEQVGDGSAEGVARVQSINGKPINRRGRVEGRLVDDVVLDTGCACTMVRRDLVPREKLVAGATIRLRCAHGDVVTYPLAAVKIEMDGVSLPVTAAVAEKLPVSVLLGTDVPELGKLINQPPQVQPDALVVTRAQAQAKKVAEATAQDKQDESQVRSSPLEEPNPFSTLDADLFQDSRGRQTLTRREKRESRHHHGLIRAKDPPKRLQREIEVGGTNNKTLQQMQESDETLADVRVKVNQSSQPFFKEEGLLYRKWEPRGKDESETVIQLVLPKDCRQKALELAHSIPLAGHLGRKKTFSRLSQRFYWPSMHQHVVEFCRRCGTCQKFNKRKPARVPMVPLPVVEYQWSHYQWSTDPSPGWPWT